jgi:hypothetical protein
MKKEYWRKSATWFILIRKHAIVYANYTEDDELWSKVGAVDEHYLPSLLASHGFDNETTCSDGLTRVMWFSKKSPHPLYFWNEQINAGLFDMFQYTRSYKKPARNSSLIESGVHREITEVGPIDNIGFSTRCSGYDGICHFVARKFHIPVIFQLLDNVPIILADDDFPDVVHPGYDWENNLRPLLRKGKKSTVEAASSTDPRDFEYYLLHATYLRLFPDLITLERMLRLPYPLEEPQTTTSPASNISLTAAGLAFLSSVPLISQEEINWYPRFVDFDFASLRDHQLVKIPKSHEIFYINYGVRRLVPNMDILAKLNLTSQDIQTIPKFRYEEIIVREPLSIPITPPSSTLH